MTINIIQLETSPQYLSLLSLFKTTRKPDFVNDGGDDNEIYHASL